MSRDNIKWSGLHRGVSPLLITAAVILVLGGCKAKDADNPPVTAPQPPVHGNMAPGSIPHSAPGKLPPPPGFHP